MEKLLRYRGSSDRVTHSRVAAITDFVGAHIPTARTEAHAAAQLFAPELAVYSELISDSRGDVAGLLVRGEDESFTTRAVELMAQWGISDNARTHYAHLAQRFRHKRNFIKLEWSRGRNGIERLVAGYFRRRPSVDDAIDILRSGAGVTVPLDHFKVLARLLGKDTVHFVSFVTKPGHGLHHKFYLSQFQTPGSYEAVRVRIARALQQFAPQPQTLARWAAYHDRLAPWHREQTVFISLASSRDGIDPSIKIDYPEVPLHTAVGVLDESDQRTAHARFDQLCHAAGNPRLSYLGVRLGLGAAPVLKGYTDLI